MSCASRLSLKLSKSTKSHMWKYVDKHWSIAFQHQITNYRELMSYGKYLIRTRSSIVVTYEMWQSMLYVEWLILVTLVNL
jgi:hypothetical protein